MTITCELTVQPTVSGYRISVLGKATLQDSPAVRDFANESLSDGVEVELDLTECEFLDSTFLGCLLVLSRKSQKLPGKFIIVAPLESQSDIFGNSRLQYLLPCVTEGKTTRGVAAPLPRSELERREFGIHVVETHRELARLGGPHCDEFQAIADRVERELQQ